MLNWIATVLYMFGGLSFALKLYPFENFAFIFFFFGHSISFINGWIKKIHSLTVRYIFFVIIDIIGIIRYDSINSLIKYFLLLGGFHES